MRLSWPIQLATGGSTSVRCGATSAERWRPASTPTPGRRRPTGTPTSWRRVPSTGVSPTWFACSMIDLRHLLLRDPRARRRHRRGRRIAVVSDDVRAGRAVDAPGSWPGSAPRWRRARSERLARRQATATDLETAAEPGQDPPRSAANGGGVGRQRVAAALLRHRRRHAALDHPAGGGGPGRHARRRGGRARLRTWPPRSTGWPTPSPAPPTGSCSTSTSPVTG